MAPELLQGTSNNTEKSDAYSFGVILYEVYARKDPYEGEDFLDVLENVINPLVNKRPIPPEACPQQIRSLMWACLHTRPDERPTFEALDITLKGMDAKALQRSESNFQDLPQKNLEDTFPPHIAMALREGSNVDPEDFEMVTVAFVAVAGFEEIAMNLSAGKCSTLLENLSHMFSELSQQHGVFQVDAVSPACWIGVTNLLEDQADHVKRIVDFAVDAVTGAQNVWIDEEDHSLGTVQLRLGLHSGPCVANAVGSYHPRYCLFGETVQTASRMEKKSENDGILLSHKSAYLLRQQDPRRQLASHGKIRLKGSLMVDTFWVRTPFSPSQAPEGAVFRTAVMPQVEEDAEEDSSEGS
jgi:class 3 adenylate cyclase